MSFYSLQEIDQKFSEQIKAQKAHMDKAHQFHPSDPEVNIFAQVKPAEQEMLKETLRRASLSQLMQEYLGNASGGAAYLIPTKIYDLLYEAGSVNDIVPLCSPIVTCPGSSLLIDVEKDGQYKAHFASGGGEAQTETMEPSQVTITPKLFNINPVITQEQIEDSQFDIMQIHLKRAAEALGQFSTEQFLGKLIAGSSTGADGTQNTVTTGVTGQMLLSDLAEAWAGNLEDGWLSDTAIVPPSLLVTLLRGESGAGQGDYASQFHDKAATQGPLEWGNFMGMNIVTVKHMNTAYTGTGSLYIGSKWTSLVLDKANATLTVRKRWMLIDKYSDPVRDLSGCVISCRQDHETIYNDASCEVTVT